MAIAKRTKNSRQRGSTSHGWGSMKKHRGAGSRGGRGRAGSGKRGDQKKPSYWKTETPGKHGFHSKSRAPTINSINISTIVDSLPTWEAKGLAKKSGDVFEVNLGKCGYNKLLANGKATLKLKLVVDFASKSAVKKLSEAGGEVTLPN